MFSVSTSGPPPAGFLAGVPDVLRLGGEGDLVRVRVRVGVDDAEIILFVRFKNIVHTCVFLNL